MGRRILTVLAALLALLWAAVPAYAASPAVDSAYLTREPWQNVPVTEFRADGAMGYYQIYADTAKSARKSSAQTGSKFAYTGGTSTGDTEEELPVQTGGTAVLTDGTYTAAVVPTHRSTVANILIYLAIALATAAVIALAVGIIKSRKAKREEAREKQRQEEVQEIEDYDE